MTSGYRKLSIGKEQPVILQIQGDFSLDAALKSLQIPQGKPTLSLVGGASKLSEADYQKVLSLFNQVLAPLAEELCLNVVDGGTDAGIMKLIGEARNTQNFHFPLVGVAPQGLVSLPNAPSAHPDASTLEPNHTHCLLIPGEAWGDESAWIAQVANNLAQKKPSITILINGGEVTWKDARCHIEAGRTVIVIQGSGRTADILATALNGEPSADQRAKPLITSGLMQSVALSESSENLKKIFKSLLADI